MGNFEDAVTKLIPRMRRYAFLFTGERSVADDLVEVALKEAVERKCELKGRISLQPWLLTILHRPLATWWDQSELQPSADLAKKGVTQRGSQGFRLQPSKNTTLEIALNALSFAERSILLLVVVEELPIEEAAGVMSLKVDVARWTLQEARTTLEEAVSRSRPSSVDDEQGEPADGLQAQDKAAGGHVLNRD